MIKKILSNFSRLNAFFFTYSTAFFERWQLAQIALLLFSRAFLGIFIKSDGISCNTGTAKKYGHEYQGGRTPDPKKFTGCAYKT